MRTKEEKERELTRISWKGTEETRLGIGGEGERCKMEEEERARKWDYKAVDLACDAVTCSELKSTDGAKSVNVDACRRLSGQADTDHPGPEVKLPQ